MSASVVEQILARVAACLAAVGLSVYRGRADAFEDDELPALNVLRGNAPNEAQDVSGVTGRSTLDFDVEFYVRASAAVETAVDALHMTAHTALMDDAQLAALGKQSLRFIGTSVSQEPSDLQAARLTARYQIDAWVLQRDLTTPT